MNTTCPYNSKQRSGALHLTQKVDYGIILLTALARPRSGAQVKNQLSIKKIAEENNVSFLFLQKIAGLLQKAGIIKAERGKFGGYKLMKELKDLNLGQIIETLEGPIAIVPCLNPRCKPACKRIGHCTVRPSMSKINNEIQNVITGKTLDYFIRST
ncbi:Rrf2 family transcriptional regulator [Candidatus Peregrinibacteria bacterium]|nr:Rrf2 family transcriptional regulator [Candidatus Peregrinibacteria bacterium]